jgi:MFS transporter, DHA2 family, multidrug resistance protein
VEQRTINPWLIAVTVTIATFMELLDTAIANVSLPHIAGGLATSYDESTWVLTSYLVANATVLPLSAWLSRVFGRKNFYMGCVAGFTLASLLCGLAPNLGWLIFFRVLQGICGGGLAPVEQAILVDTFPAAKRAAAFGLYSMAIVTAPALGPPLGGWITDTLNWRWVFFINVPIGLISLLLTSRLVSDPPEFKKQVEEARSQGKLRIDYAGILLIALGFSFLEVVLDRGQQDDWFESQFIIWFLVVGVSALVVAVVWEWRHPDPVVEIQLLRERNFALSNVLYFLFSFVLFGSTVLIPQMLQSLYGYTATDAGLVLGPGAGVIVILAPLVVQLVPRVGASRLIAFASVVLALAMWKFASFDMTADYAHEAWARAYQGLGLAFFFVPVSQVAYSYLPREKNNKGSSLTNLFRNQGGSFGISLMTTLLARRQQFHLSVLTVHANIAGAASVETIGRLKTVLINAGLNSNDAALQAQGRFYGMVKQQAAMMSFLDCFRALGFVAILALPVALFIKPFGKEKKNA